MATLDFPNSPTTGQTFTGGGVTWKWDGAKWVGFAGPAVATTTNIKTFTASGTYTAPSNLISAVIEVVGGGGGGGGIFLSAGGVWYVSGGGGSGGYSRSIKTAAQIGASQAVTIGVGGGGGNGTPTAGVAGGATSFGSLVVANGGQGGQGASDSWGFGGGGAAIGTGDVAVGGESGGHGFYDNLYASIGTSSSKGGSSYFGGGGRPNWGGDGGAGIAFGAGGAGTGWNGAGGFNGGSGSYGICIVTEFIAAPAPLPAGTPVAVLAPNIRVFTSSATYTPSANLVSAQIECIGGGGGGAGAAGAAGSGYAGGGGGSGGYSRSVRTAAQIGASQVVTVGAAGAAGAAGNFGGGAGGNTSVGTLCVANGGPGGVVAGQSGASGALPGTGDVAAAGAPGEVGWYGTGTTAIAGWTGAGGSSIFGGGAQSFAIGNAANNGSAAGNFGSGGSGGVAHNIAANAAGGSGSAGVVVITEYISQTALQAPPPVIQGAAVLPNYLGGLTLANDGVSPNTVIDIAVGGATSDDNANTMILNTVNFTKNCNAAWSLGSGGGALDSGSALAASTWYHVFLIMRTDTNVVDALISTSTSPTMPASYNRKRRIGSIGVDGNAHIVAFFQDGDRFSWSNSTWDIWNAVSVTMNTPYTLRATTPPFVTTAILVIQATAASACNMMVFTPGSASTGVGVVHLGGGNWGGARYEVQTDSSGQVVFQSNNTLTSAYLSTYGWIDNRGK
jgi:hypothetical protein